MEASEPGPVRIHLAGGIAIQRGDLLLDERRLPGAQGRVAFAMLVAERRRSVTREELAGELWTDEPPRAWDAALRALVSKLRSLLAAIGLPGPNVIAHAGGAYQVNLPAGAWVDLEAAADGLHRAERALRDGRPREAAAWALAPRFITRGPFLPGAGGRWAARTRDRLLDARVRALACLGRAWIELGDAVLAVRDAEEAVALAPFREESHRLLMRAHAAGGNRGEALRAYARCRSLLAEELGVDPAPETEALYLELLRAGAAHRV